MTQDALVARILTQTKVIALVGWSPKPDRPSHRVAAYLAARGYRVIPVNPGLAGQQILGQTVYASLGDIPKPVDMVDIFRNSDAAGPITDQALALSPKPRVIWMQLSVRNDEAALRAEAVAARLRAGDPADLLTIALEEGFGSKASFNRAFAARHGVAPSAFRRQVSNPE